ncbi:hypothetical protein S7S_10505 [Isoalcanivorax pacificus W11-5]|uniref:HTH cro/C1-type domain-containing protein n=1 Tax=Isoalcanivorax pacificus W11-5 TaxID=391936 RepID=A0A0B4XQ19_9GAMM|nr:type II toxin-antitoxin system MqsA family antitoxin [Isoalcanivorax pacificus]AJD48513.1 hypothetical protein S7S_10505 [Isoalcanivorax pacificus W11-5]
MTINKCLVCDSDQLVEVVEDVALKAGEFMRTLPIRATECASCGCSFHTPEQERDNKRQRLAFRKMAEGLLTGAEIRAIRERHGLSQKRAAEVFGGGPVAFAKYEADDVAQSQAMDRLLRVFDAVPEARVVLSGETPELVLTESVSKPDIAILDSLGKDLVFYVSMLDGFTAFRRHMNEEEEVSERLVAMLRRIGEPPRATRAVEWRPVECSAPEWRH